MSLSEPVFLFLEIVTSIGAVIAVALGMLGLFYLVSQIANFFINHDEMKITRRRALYKFNRYWQ